MSPPDGWTCFNAAGCDIWEAVDQVDLELELKQTSSNKMLVWFERICTLTAHLVKKKDSWRKWVLFQHLIWRFYSSYFKLARFCLKWHWLFSDHPFKFFFCCCCQWVLVMRVCSQRWKNIVAAKCFSVSTPRVWKPRNGSNNFISARKKN